MQGDPVGAVHLHARFRLGFVDGIPETHCQKFATTRGNDFDIVILGLKSQQSTAFGVGQASEQLRSLEPHRLVFDGRSREASAV